jgi:hypothetical protein
VGHIVHSGSFRAQNVDALFFMLGWDRYGLRKKHVGTRYAKQLFLHPMGTTGPIVHSGVPGVQNIDALFLMIGWDQYGFDIKRIGTRYTELMFSHPVGFAGHVVHSGASQARNVDVLFFMLEWTSTDSTKSAPRHVTPNQCFAFCCVWA